MAKIYLYPNGQGDYTGIRGSVPPANHWDKVDDPWDAPDEDATYVEAFWPAPFLQKDAYTLTPTGVFEGTINSVRVVCREKTNAPGEKVSVRLGLRKDGIEELKPEAVILNWAWYTVWNHFATNPSGGAWTWENFAGLQVVLGLDFWLAPRRAKCTQIYVEIDYVPVPVPYSQCSELVDGYMEGDTPLWPDIHDAPSCLAPTCAMWDDEEHIVAGATFMAPGYYVARAWLYFDTSHISSDAIITQAILALSLEGGEEDNPGYATLHVVKGVQASPLQPPDWGNHLGMVTSGGSIAFADWIPGGYTPIVLNPLGRSWINKGGITKFCLRVAADIDNTPPPGPGVEENGMEIYSAEKGPLYCPRLHINYTPAVVAPLRVNRAHALSREEL